jgi:hypothetical protein
VGSNAVNKLLIETYFKKLKMPQAAKVYISLAREVADNNLDMKSTCYAYWNKKYNSGKATGSREVFGKQVSR